jgi:ribosome biogenesis ATPase
MNSRLSALYTGPVTGDAKDDEDDCEVIEVDDDGEETAREKEVVTPAAAEEPVTEYERIQARARAAAAQLKDPAPKKAKPKGDKSLESSVSPAPSMPAPPSAEDDGDQDEICEVISDDNEKDSTPACRAREASKSSTSSSPLVTPGQSSRQGLLARAVGRRIEQEEAVAESRKRPLETPSSKKKQRKTETAVVVAEMSTVTFADFGGNDQVVGQVCRLLVHLRHPEVYDRLGVSPPRGFLLHGPPGCGKTLLAHAIAGELKLPFIKVAAPELVSGVSGDSEGRIRELFDQATAAAPCVLFIDEIDSITGRRETAAKQMEGRMVAQLVASLDGLGPGVVVVGATGRLEALDPALRRAGRFDREIGLGIPDRAARERILEVVCRGLRLAPGTCLATLATLSPGYVGADLTSLAREAAMAAVNRVLGGRLEEGATTAGLLAWGRGEGAPLAAAEREQLSIAQADWKEALRTVQPSAKREGFATVPGVTWADVGALEAVREELQLSILAPVHHGAQFEGLGLPSSSGVLLVGPPGCGKTLVAKAIANEAGINFISVKGPELINMYVGESERAVRGVFQRAKNSAPCVIFFDEVDSLCPRRSSGSSDGGSSSRVVNQLLTELDGVEGRWGDGSFIRFNFN